ncbi:MAG: putative photosynthetic complex assembly protein PuhE [Novosphingobium sp.]
MSLAGHVVPFVVTLLVWFFATGLIAWLDNRDPATFPRALMIAGASGIAGLVAVVVGSLLPTIAGVYIGFIGALMVWSWHEASFLMGAVAGPRREPSRPSARGWDRFIDASSTLIYHEIALALTAVMLLSLSWNAPNPMGAQVFVLLFALRLSSKLVLYAGVPNQIGTLLPPHLEYLCTYFGPQRFSAAFLCSLVGTFALAAWLGSNALAAPAGSAEAVSASLLFTLGGLGAIEHVFFALPFRDGALWGWALPSRTNRINA